MYHLNSKVIWLTGASQGIGAALCKELVARGAIVAVTARSQDILNDLQHENSSKIFSFPGDVTDLTSMKEIAKKIQERVGPLDILIANAGSCFYIDEESFSSEHCLSLMQLNYGGVLHCLEAVLPQMLTRGSGRIVGVASLAGYRGLLRAGAYGATKAGLINFLESIRFQLERRGIDVTVVNPGFVATPLTAKNNFPMPALVSAEKSARYICDGIESRKKEIAYPFSFALLMKLMRVMPFSLYECLVKIIWKN